MALYKAYDKNVEVNGQTIRTVIDGMSIESKAKKYLEDEGIEDPKTDEWYPQQSWLDAFKKIAEDIGDATLKRIGKKIPKNADWPPGVDTVEKALNSIDEAYHMNHRGGKIGHYDFEKTGEGSGKMVCDDPYPDAFDEGIIEQTTKDFADNKLAVSVEIDNSKPTRAGGAESTTYQINW